MTQLNQIIAVEKGVRARTLRAGTDVYHNLQKTQLFSGLSRTYQPKDEEGEQLPAERSYAQLRAEDLLRVAAAVETELLDVTLTKDVANTEATADVVVDGVTIASDVPVTYLLFLEKRLTDLRTMLAAVPTLDPSESWEYDTHTDTFRSAPVQTTRTKKIPRNHVLAEATDRHPAQVQVYQEDVVVGYWTKVAFSGAVTAARRNELLARTDKLIDAVKKAREQANTTEVGQQYIGHALFGWLLAYETR